MRQIATRYEIRDALNDFHGAWQYRRRNPSFFDRTSCEHHQRRRIPNIGITPRSMDAWLDTLPRI
jgi:hypothetical protein